MHHIVGLATGLHALAGRDMLQIVAVPDDDVFSQEDAVSAHDWDLLLAELGDLAAGPPGTARVADLQHSFPMV